MRIDRIDSQLLKIFEGKAEDERYRVIIKLAEPLDPDRVELLRILGANGALEETVYISTKLTRSAIEKLSDEDWVKAIETPADPTYHPDPPKWLVQ
ncbi:MAG: hypothetical protein HY226_06250 [Candidatus Vogelbacteria bacterium]|nr:hypothetical protein [Candidatus Vogelbacteria bacterium]